jgi:hypothetical protein
LWSEPYGTVIPINLPTISSKRGFEKQTPQGSSL